MKNILDEITPAFKAVANRWPDGQNIQVHYADLASTFENKGSSLIELCKSFLESVCITIINELGGTVPTNCSTTQYFIAALDKLGLRNARGASSFDKVLSAHNKLADALTDIRNQEGSVGHGKDGFIDSISDHHARVYLLSTDTIIDFLMQAYDGVEPSILKTREPHTRFFHHNQKIDAETQVEAGLDEEGIVVLSFRAGILEEGFDIRVTASELLYYLDRQAYVDVLDALRGITTKPKGDDLQETEEQIPELKPSVKPKEVVVGQKELLTQKLKPVIDYRGRYAEQVSPLYDFIFHSILEGNSRYATQIQNLTYTLLKGMEDLAVIDWNERTSTYAAVRLYLKRLIKLFSIDEIKVNSIEQIVEWLAKHIPGN